MGVQENTAATAGHEWAAGAHPSLVILGLQNRLAAWYLVPPAAPRRLLVHGEQSPRLGTPEALVSAYQDIAGRLQGEGHNPGAVHWLLDEAARRLWTQAQPQPNPPPLQAVVWQSICWEWLVPRFGLDVAQPWGAIGMFEREVLPWLVTANDAAERRQMQQARERQHLGETERLAAERGLLQQENQHLRAQNAALQRADAEQLVSFLPALFGRVFTVLGAADLALLCGRIEPLTIPNPYPEPSEETLRAMQKNFCALPPALQQQIVGFVARLPQRQKLQPRPEMRELIHELEGR